MPKTRRQRGQTGLTLLETAVLISVLGVSLAALVPTFLRHVRVSKVSEASEQLAEMHRRTAAYYGTSRQFVSGRRHRRCLPESAGPAPALPSPVPVDVDFAAETTPGHDTWAAIGFLPRTSLRFRYSLLTEHAGCAPRPPGTPARVTFVAEGDLDGDGVLSRFERSAVADPESDELRESGRLRMQNRLE